MPNSLTVARTLPAFVDGEPAADRTDQLLLEVHPTLDVTVWLADAETYGAEELGVRVCSTLPRPSMQRSTPPCSASSPPRQKLLSVSRLGADALVIDMRMSMGQIDMRMSTSWSVSPWASVFHSPTSPSPMAASS